MTLDELLTGGKPAVARALSLIERRGRDDATVALLEDAWAAPRGHVIGLTGPPGVGKSTLSGALIRALRARGRTVGVLAVDPSSVRSGGALLGDRARLDLDPTDQGVFVRSMATRGALGGLSALAYPAAVLLRAVYDVVLLETVGVGQSEIAVAGVADTVVLCVQPASGDGLQFMKSGVMETPDVVLVTKADLGAPARRAAAEARQALALFPAREDGCEPSVLLASAQTGERVGALLDTLDTRRVWLESRRAALQQKQARAWLWQALTDRYGRAGTAALRPFYSESIDAPPFRQERALGRKMDNLLKRIREI